MTLNLITLLIAWIALISFLGLMWVSMGKIIQKRRIARSIRNANKYWGRGYAS